MFGYVLQSSAGEAFAYGLTATCCAILIVIIVIIALIIIFLWRMSSSRKVEVHTTTNLDKSRSSDRYCPECGRGIPFDSKTCPYCSKKFSD